MGLDYDDVTEILELLEHSNVDYLEIEVGGSRLVASRSGPVASGPVASGPADVRVPSAAGTPPAPPEVPGGASGATRAEPIAGTSSGGHAPGGPGEHVPSEVSGETTVVRAPMVGVFYRRPDPGSPPFVEVGSRVAQGDTLGLLEVMKMFTGVTAPASGEVVEILVEDSGFVEFDQPLVRIRPERA